MNPFKFLIKADEKVLCIVDAWDGASWIYGRVENLVQYQYDIIIDNYLGIRSFLNPFPPEHVVCVLSITGPDGRVHDIDNNGDGWGFDILSDLITIEWVRFRQM